MYRILLILALAVLLLPERHSQKDLAVRPGTLLVSATPVPLDSGDPQVTSVGPLRWLGSWVLTSPHKDFGGISSMIVTPERSVLALSDSGTLMGFHLGPGGARPFIAPIPKRPGEESWPNWKWDSESMIHDRETGQYWVGFELLQWVCRYSRGFARVESCSTWPEMKKWPDTGGAEAMVRLPDGRFLVFSEMGYGPGNGNDLLLFDGDPADPATHRPQRLNYIPPPGYRPTDAVVLNDHRLIVLNRRVTLFQGFTGSVALVDLPPLRAGATLVGREIARLAPPLLADNYEALALDKEDGRSVLWIASDDNHEFYQRTLLLKFALPRDLAGD